MDNDPDLGGACGEIEVEKSDYSFLTAVQFFEYKLSHYLDKTFEGLFNYQSVLPGAFSIFRWEAIKDQPLEEFFKGLKKESLNLRDLNKYLAEDRIMCFEIITQKRNDDKKFHLIYEPSAVA